MIALLACTGCGHMVFPARTLCSRCGNAAWQPVPCSDAVIEAVTTVRRASDAADPVSLACVRTPQGVHVIARIERPLPPGADVTLHETADRAIWARQTMETTSA